MSQSEFRLMGCNNYENTIDVEIKGILYRYQPTINAMYLFEKVASIKKHSAGKALAFLNKNAGKGVRV